MTYWFIEGADGGVDIERCIFARRDILEIVILIMGYIKISNWNDR
jgi:hypothetical protein